MKVIWCTYFNIALIVFGLVASGPSECDEKARDVSKCRATTAMVAGVAWPLYGSWVAMDAVREARK
jgi:hypothetical protein